MIMVKLFLGGFPLDSDELELVQLLAPFVTVVTIKIVRNKLTKVSKGYAFLEVTDKIDAQAAIFELNSTMYKGRELTLNIVEDEPAPTPVHRYVKAGRGGEPEKKKRPRKI